MTNCEEFDMEITDYGNKGDDGLSAYEIAVKNGFVGTEQEWLTSLKGQKGDTGANGQNGTNGKDASINGYNTIEIVAGTNVDINQQGNKLTINATNGGGSTSEVTKKYVDEQIAKTLDDAKTYTDQKVPTAEEKLAWNNKANTSDIPTKLSELENDTNFAKKTEIPKKTSQLLNDSGFLTEHQSLIEYAKKTELPKKTSQLENDSNFLTQHQSLKDYAKTSEVENKLANKVTNSKGVSKVWSGTQSEYDQLPTKEETTIYFIKE